VKTAVKNGNSSFPMFRLFVAFRIIHNTGDHTTETIVQLTRRTGNKNVIHDESHRLCSKVRATSSAATFVFVIRIH
jgi:hypothetical protein